MTCVLINNVLLIHFQFLMDCIPMTYGLIAVDLSLHYYYHVALSCIIY